MRHLPTITKKLLSLLPVITLVLSIGTLATASAAFIPIPESLCGVFPCPAGSTSLEMTKNLTGKIVDNVRYVIGAVAILMIVVSGVRLIVSSGNEEEYTKQSMSLIYGIVGLFLVALAGELANIVSVDNGGFLKDPNVAVQRSRLFTRTVGIVITFIKYIIGSISVTFIVRNSLRLIFKGDEEEEIGKTKKNIWYGIIGLLVIMMANPAINNVFYKIDTQQFQGVNTVRPGIDTALIIQEIAGVTNVVAALTGPLALLAFVAGGLMYVLAAGEEEKIGKAKKIMMWSAIAILIIYGAFAMVSLFISGQFQGI